MTIAVYASIYKRHKHSSHLAIRSTMSDTLHNLFPSVAFTLVLKQKVLNNWVKQSFCLCPFCKYTETEKWVAPSLGYPMASMSFLLIQETLIEHLSYLSVLFIILYLKLLSRSQNYQQVLMFILFISSRSCRIFLDPFILNFFCPHQ